MKRFFYLLYLARKSAWNRRSTLALIVCSIALSTTLLLGIEKLRTQIRENFVQSVSGTDLIVGARGSAVQLILYAIFHLGSVNNNISWKSVHEIEHKDAVAWTIPISLGDFHRDYPVVATTNNFFTNYRYRGGQKVTFVQGRAFTTPFDIVLGSEVARNLGYVLGQELHLSHGNSGNASHASEHKESFTVCGILAPTGTPADRSLYIGLQAMEAIHAFLHHAEHETPVEEMHPESVTALLVGLKKRSQVFSLRREINQWQAEALMGVLPGVAMNEIWQMVNTGEQVLLLISALVTIVGLAGLVATILAGLGERRRELAILRSIGARPRDILLVLTFEGFSLVFLGMLAGVVLLYGLEFLLAPILADKYGIFLYFALPTFYEWMLVVGIGLAGILASLLPAYKAYKISLSDGLTVSA